MLRRASSSTPLHVAKCFLYALSKLLAALKTLSNAAQQRSKYP